MANDELRRTLTRITDARDARRAVDLGAASAAAPTSAAARAAFTVGDRVFDVASGREGSVTRVGAADNIGRTPIDVVLDGGAAVARLARDLIARPRRPAARS